MHAVEESSCGRQKQSRELFEMRGVSSDDGGDGKHPSGVSGDEKDMSGKRAKLPYLLPSTQVRLVMTCGRHGSSSRAPVCGSNERKSSVSSQQAWKERQLRWPTSANPD